MVAAATAALAACGDRGSSVQPEAGGSSSWRFELTTTTAHEDPSELRFAGAFDRELQVGRALVEAPREKDAFYTSCDYEYSRFYPEEERVVAGNAYERWSTWGKSYWIRKPWGPGIAPFYDVLEMVAPFPIGVLAPTEVVDRMRQYGDGVETLGTEMVRGHETTLYRTRIDIAHLYGRSREWERPPEHVLNRTEQRRVPVEVDAWIDSADRVRRMTIRLGVEGLGSLGDVMTYSLDVFDYGVRVDVAAPTKVVTLEDYYEAAEEGGPLSDDECVQWRPEEDDS
jgi:hypothetical protein